MNSFSKFFANRIAPLKNSRGQTIIEYCLIIVLIAIIVIAMLKGVGTNANNAFSTINSALS